MIKRKYYFCKSFGLLKYLMKSGYMYLKEDKDRNNPKRTVWLFDDSPELRTEVDRYYVNKDLIRV